VTVLAKGPASDDERDKMDERDKKATKHAKLSVCCRCCHHPITAAQEPQPRKRPKANAVRREPNCVLFLTATRFR